MGVDVRVDLFGETAVRAGGRRLDVRDFGGGKPRQVLELLALHAPASLPKDRLADLLWEGDPPPGCVATLEAYVSVLRQALDPGGAARHSVVVTVPGGYRLDVERVDVDLLRFERGVRAAFAALTTGAAGSARLVDEMLELSAAELLASDRYASWAQAARTAVERRSAELASAGAARALEVGDLARAERLARRATDLDPFGERAWRQRMRALWRAGRRGEALRVFAELVTLLEAELGVSPDTATCALRGRILRGGPPDGATRPDDDLDRLARLVAELVLRAADDADWPRTTSVSDLADRLGERLRPFADRLLGDRLLGDRPVPDRPLAAAG